MKKQFIKMNNNDEYLSIGNLFRIIKDTSKNKVSALQSELFCILFEIENINDTTVNNYCVGCRSIGGEYKQIYINKKKKYEHNKEEFCNNIIGILSIIDGLIYNIEKEKITFINNNESAHIIAKKLYNLAKNDKQVIKEFTNNLYHLIEKNNIYECLVEEICFIILEHKQPLYEEELKKEVLENVLNDTSISSIDLQEYLSLKLREGINFDHSMKKLAASGNAYANFELGSNEYYGYHAGYPRYDKAYTYLSVAASLNHAGANYMLANMLIRGLIGTKTPEELRRGYEYLVKSYNLGNVAASNLIGNMYQKGIYPLEQNIDKAIEFYNEASQNNYAYAYNNLGKIEESKGNKKEAFAYYLKSADLGESWACNKVGEYYRQGITDKDIVKSFYYYNRATESNYKNVCYYSYYNLAKYFYKNGYDLIPVEKDLNKYLDYLKLSSDNNILEATIELLTYFTSKYLEQKNEEYFNIIINLKNKIESHPKYNDYICKEVETTLKQLLDKREISNKLIEDIHNV